MRKCGPKAFYGQYYNGLFNNGNGVLGGKYMPDNSYDLSVIIPFFNNGAEEIKNAIQSVLDQSSIKVEIVIVDDGSENNISNLIEEYVESIPNIRFISQNNAGVSSARNRGLHEASGSYITFLDADDRLTEQFFSTMKEIFRFQPDMILGGSKIVRQNKMCQTSIKKRLIHCNTSEDIHTWKCRLFGKTYYFSSEEKVVLNRGIAAKVVKSEIAKQLSMKENLKLGEDTTWFLQAISVSHYIIICNQLWYLYTDNLESATRKFNPNIIEQSRESLFSIRQEINILDQQELMAYTDRIIRELQFISDNYINYPNNKIGVTERWSILCKIYSEEPWACMKTNSKSSKDYHKTIFMYKTRTLFLWWYIKKKLKEIMSFKR